jgi:hypothetical protein
MTTKRSLIALVLGGVTIALVTASLPLLAVIWDSLSPDAVSWDSKSAFVKCESAIARDEWPVEASRACSAMHLCANEATLSPTQTAGLRNMAKRTPGCGDF